MVSNLFPGANVISAIAAAIATLLSLHLMYKHIKYWQNKEQQTPIIRILWMIPIYGVDCAISTWWPDATKYVDPMRDCYEAFVLYSFVAYLKACLNTERSELSSRFEGRTAHHLFPFNLCLFRKMFCLKDEPKLDRMFFRRTEQGVIQYMLIKPLLAGIQLVLTLDDRYEGGLFDYDRGYSWVLLFTNLSQTCALYCLIYIHHAIHAEPEMQGKNLLGKLLCIKAVVFFAFWQSCFFAVLEHFSVITDSDTMTADVRAVALEDFILCVEMVIIAFVHRKVFSHLEYRAVLEPVNHALKQTGWRGPEDDVDHSTLDTHYQNMTEAELEAMAAAEKENRGSTKAAAVVNILNITDVAADVKQHLMPSQGMTPEQDHFITPKGDPSSEEGASSEVKNTATALEQAAPHLKG